MKRRALQDKNRAHQAMCVSIIACQAQEDHERARSEGDPGVQPNREPLQYYRRTLVELPGLHIIELDFLEARRFMLVVGRGSTRAREMEGICRIVG